MAVHVGNINRRCGQGIPGHKKETYDDLKYDRDFFHG
jgi:hypothetical protein